MNLLSKLTRKLAKVSKVLNRVNALGLNTKNQVNAIKSDIKKPVRRTR